MQADAKLVYPDDDLPQIEGRLIDSLGDIASAGLVAQVIEQYEHLRCKAETTGVTPVFNLAAQSPHRGGGQAGAGARRGVVRAWCRTSSRDESEQNWA